jgi:hypothetical protein
MSSKSCDGVPLERLTPPGTTAPIRSMQDDKTSPPQAPSQTVADARREREAEALRANLRKRKDQQRARATPTDGRSPVLSEDSPVPLEDNNDNSR